MTVTSRNSSEAANANASVTAAAPEISFVIPAFNEEKFITTTLQSIHRVMAARFKYEIVVVDNGSTDETAALARAQGARVYVRPAETVAGLRNFGARQCNAAVLVFLDADVTLTETWGSNIAGTLSDMATRPQLLTGSMCGVPEHPTWIEKYWFAPKLGGGNTHINSGHLVVGRAFFQRLGGFDVRLQTGEDYEFSMRALRAEGEMEENPSLEVVHYGYPRSLIAFVRREAWHGRGDFTSLATVFHSRVALATLAFVGLHAVLLWSIASAALLTMSLALAGVALLCLAAAVRQYRRHPWNVIVFNTFVYYFYFVGRSVALMRAISMRTSFLHRDHR